LTMPSEQMASLIRRLQDKQHGGLDAVSPQDCAQLLGVDGICISVTRITAGLMQWSMIWCSDNISEALNDLRCRLVEGPGVNAVLRNTAVLVPDLDSPIIRAQWPGYTKAALDLGVRAVFAFPLRRQLRPFGAIIAYRKRQGFPQHINDGAAFAEAAARTIEP